MLTSVDQLRADLGSKFDLICFVDLAVLAGKHSTAFSVLTSAYKQAYTSDQRLVFYSSHPIDQIFANHLQQAASRVDVSNGFILVCTPFDIQKELQQANQLYGYDDTVISWKYVDLQPTEQIKELNFYSYESGCPLPFSSMLVNSSGDVTTCCKIKEKSGSIYSNTLSEIFFGEHLTDLRNQMRQGIKPGACRVCWKIENLGGISLRQHAIDKYRDRCDRGWLDDLKIRDISVTPSTLCNFKCRICSPDESSQIAVEELQYATGPEKIIKLKQSLKLAGSDWFARFQESMASVYDDLNHLHVLGGEPFMFPRLKALLEQMITSGHANHIQLEFNTNGSYWPEEIVALFDQFEKIEILVSIDNIGDRFEIERGGSWDLVKQNIQKFVALSSDRIAIKLAITINVQNILYLNELAQFADHEKIGIVWWYLERPDYLCIDNLTQSLKELVYEKYHNHPIKELANIALRVQQTPAVSGQAFINYTDMIDRRRGQLFSKTHHEVYQAMNKLL
jgi:MoaA/NifB/PqqE/SkfB family radical SAM enzyme